MLTQLLGKLVKRPKRQWTESEIRELIRTKEFELAHTATQALHAATPERALRQLCLQAEIAFHTHRDDDAQALFAEALKQAPGFADAHLGLSLLMQARGDHQAAYQHALFALGNAPSEPRYLSQMGLCHIYLGNLPQAEDLLRRALQQAPADVAAWNNLGLSLLSRGRLTEARSCFVNAVKLDPDFGLAHQNLAQLDADTPTQPGTDAEEGLAPQALLLERDDESLEPHCADLATAPPVWSAGWNAVRQLASASQRVGAMNALEALLSSHPEAPELAVLADRLYRSLGEADSGMAVLQAFLVRHPDDPQVHQGMGMAMLQRADHIGAERHLRKALDAGRRELELLKAMGRVLFKQERFAEALPFYEECQRGWPSPVHLGGVAIACYQTCEYDLAIAHFESLEADGLLARFGLLPAYAQSLAYVGRMEEAAAIMDGLLAQHTHAPAFLKMARASLHLILEEFEHGWDGYRHRQLGLSSFRVLPVPEWKGEDLNGKTIVVLAEQGLGDQIMFASCLPDLLALKPARTIVEAVIRVARTLKRSFPECEFVNSRQDRKMEWLRDIKGVDYYVPLGELPGIFRRSLASFPRQAYLRPAPERVRFWRRRMESLGPGPYFGTSWRGGNEATRRTVRSLSPAMLKPLVDARPAQWINLQYGDVTEELAVATRHGVHLTHWPEGIADLDEFAALVAALDGVFTVCNTTVHYAGAVGQRTCVLSPQVPEWRYGLHNTHMPWYPHVELLRQRKPNDWRSVLEQACQRLLDNNWHIKHPKE
jgi:Flp pilus assembly protein TadD